MNMSKDAFIINDVESLAYIVRKNAAATFSKSEESLDEYITINQVIDIIYRHTDITNNSTMILDEDDYNKIFNDIRVGIYNSALSKLAAKGYIECAWDNESNDMIFWPLLSEL
jgi:hypothetical protein